MRVQEWILETTICSGIHAREDGGGYIKEWD